MSLVTIVVVSRSPVFCKGILGKFVMINRFWQAVLAEGVIVFKSCSEASVSAQT